MPIRSLVALLVAILVVAPVAYARERTDLVIRLGGQFVDHVAAGRSAPDLIVNYYTATPDPDRAGAQVVIWGERPGTEQIYREVLKARSQQFDVRTEHDIDGAKCWRFGYANSPTYAVWHCLYRDYHVSVAKQDNGKTNIDEVAMLRTLFQRLAAGAAPTPAPMPIVVMTPDGKAVTIDLSQWQGGKLSVEQMALAKEFELKPLGGGPPYRLQAWQYPGARQGYLPVFVPIQRLDDASYEAAESAVAWAKANPAKASLAALGLAISIALPYTTAFQASAAAGMTFLESAGIGFMTSATPAAVQSLVTSTASGKGFWETTGEAAKAGGIAGAESLVSTTVGAGVTGGVEYGTRHLVGMRVSEAAVKGFGVVASGITGSTTDLAVGVVHDRVAESIGDSAAGTAIPISFLPSGRRRLAASSCRC